MATTVGSEYDHIEVASGGNAVKHYLKDNTARGLASGLYEGKNLATAFASEIAGYSDAWAWIQARITAGNFNGINVGDYIPVTCTNNTSFDAVIMGINTYKGGPEESPSNARTGNHIDFIFSKAWPTQGKFNLVDYNNGGYYSKYEYTADGSATVKSPYAFDNNLLPRIKNVTRNINLDPGTHYTYNPDTLDITFLSGSIPASGAEMRFMTVRVEHIAFSNIHAYLNSQAHYVPNGTAFRPEVILKDYTTDGVFYYLPSALQNVISGKSLTMPTRYGASELVTTPEDQSTKYLGRIWLLTEVEIYGRAIAGSAKFTSGQVQYPLFKNNTMRIIPDNITSSYDMSMFMTYSEVDGTSDKYSAIKKGYIYSSPPSSTHFFRPCFRVAAG